MQILDLRQAPQYIPVLAAWHHRQWSYLNPGQSIEARLEKMQHYLGGDFIPSTFVALDDGLMGSAAIVASDMDTRPELSPWLASVFVAPGHRQEGVGGKLVRHVVQKAKEAGIETLYLFTPDREAFYRELEWSVLAREPYRGHQVTLMQIKPGA